MKEKIKTTNKEKFGVDNPSQNEEIKEKKKKTYIKNYGVEHYSQTKKFREDTSRRMKNGGSSHANSFIKNPSKPQVELYKLVKELHEDAILQFPVKEVNKTIDIVIPSLMIAIEYDSSYFHDLEKDKIRQSKLENLGWKFIRYLDKLPTKDKITRDITNVK